MFGQNQPKTLKTAMTKFFRGNWFKIFIVLVALVFIFVFSTQNNSPSGPESGLNISKTGIEAVLDTEFSFENMVHATIDGVGEYTLDCRTKYYSAINLGGVLIPDAYFKISDGHEQQTLYVEGENAKFFGADFAVLQDDFEYLIIMRNYSVSGLTEVITLNKGSGLGFDTKTIGFGVSGGPISDTYILKCIEI